MLLELCIGFPLLETASSFAAPQGALVSVYNQARDKVVGFFHALKSSTRDNVGVVICAADPTNLLREPGALI